MQLTFKTENSVWNDGQLLLYFKNNHQKNFQDPRHQFEVADCLPVHCFLVLRSLATLVLDGQSVSLVFFRSSLCQ